MRAGGGGHLEEANSHLFLKGESVFRGETAYLRRVTRFKAVRRKRGNASGTKRGRPSMKEKVR